MRNIISFIVAAALFVGGLWTVCVQLFGGQIQEQLLGGGFLAVLGGRLALVRLRSSVTGFKETE